MFHVYPEEGSPSVDVERRTLTLQEYLNLSVAISNNGGPRVWADASVSGHLIADLFNFNVMIYDMHSRDPRARYLPSVVNEGDVIQTIKILHSFVHFDVLSVSQSVTSFFSR